MPVMVIITVNTSKYFISTYNLYLLLNMGVTGSDIP
jgi:hypothetical protein